MIAISVKGLDDLASILSNDLASIFSNDLYLK